MRLREMIADAFAVPESAVLLVITRGYWAQQAQDCRNWDAFVEYVRPYSAVPFDGRTPHPFCADYAKGDRLHAAIYGYDKVKDCVRHGLDWSRDFRDGPWQFDVHAAPKKMTP